MALQAPPKLTENAKPRILEEGMLKRFVTVSKTAIVINIKSTEFTSRTITYSAIPKFPNEEEDWYRYLMEEDGVRVEEVKDDKKIYNCTNEPLILHLKSDQYGSHFTFHVISRDRKSGLVTENYAFLVRAELTTTEMNDYLNHILSRISPKMEEAMFYRNFTAADETRITTTNNGFFEMSRKERSGHRSSPLYQNLDNITFFSCKLFKTYPPIQDPEKLYLPAGYKLPPSSPFGDIRMAYPADKILNEKSVLFLGGMHCYETNKANWAHYVSTVVCQRDSISYHMCLEKGLIELDWEDNPILQWDKNTGKIYCAKELKREEHQEWPHDVWVEIILCDQPVALADGFRSECNYKQYFTDHQSSSTCQACHGYSSKSVVPPVQEKCPLKRRSLEDNCATPEKAMKEN